MQRSIIERVFPKPRRSLLPQYDEQPSNYRDEAQELGESSVPERSISENRVSSSTGSRRSSSSNSRIKSPQPQLQAVSLSTSLVHHDDPFIAVDRAAATLQRTIQSLLDFQSNALTGRHQHSNQDEVSSQRSLTPTQSTTTRSQSSSPSAQRLSSSRATPVRQPPKKRMNLQSARRGLIKSMQEFATLKEEELKITNEEQVHRRTALDRVTDFETKREAVRHEIRALKERASGGDAQALRAEAGTVEDEIHELEGRLMELKARHRHLVDRATQLENTAASELSSYEGTLAAIDRETRTFLRRPPVKQSLGPRSLGAAREQQGQDMYALRSERRTLDLAKDQWTGELDLLDAHGVDVERDHQALLAGAAVWQETVQKIDDFEKGLRAKMKSTNSNSTKEIVTSLDSTMQFLQEKLSYAESHDWKLLICAIGAELEAFRQARLLLAPDEPLPDFTENSTTNGNRIAVNDEDSDVPHADLLGAQSPKLTASMIRKEPNSSSINQGSAPTHHSPTNSNESLKATLKHFPADAPRAAGSSTLMSTSTLATKATSPPKSAPIRQNTINSESEDDDPGPDFLISH